MQEAGLAAQSKPIAVKAAQSSIHSFAAADVNKTVYIQSDATLGLTMTAHPIGTVYNDTTMVISS
jgi:hypothetical protein